MRKFNITLLILYVFVAVYIALFNWEIFSLILATDIGFSEINVPLIAFIFISGFTFLVAQMLGNYALSGFLQKSRGKMQAELETVKESLNNINLKTLEGIQQTVNEIRDKLENPEIKNSENILEEN